MGNLFLFTGEESYLLREQIHSWKQAFSEKHGDMNLDSVDGEETPLNEIMAALSALPFLGEKRLIFIQNLPEAPKTRNADKITKKDEAREEQLKKLETFLEDLPETTVAVFVQPNPDKRKSFYKKLAAKAELKEFHLLQGAALNAWIQKEAVKQGGAIGSNEANYLVSLCGDNLWRLSGELSKLAHYAERKPIGRSHIDALVVPLMEANIFHLTDALGAKNSQKAIASLHRSMAAGESLRPVFYMVVRQFRLLLEGGGYIEAHPNANASAFASALKLHPFVARNTFAQLKHFRSPELKKAYARLLEIDTGLKTSRIRVTVDDQDELALAIERFILDFCLAG